jgi:hypothetical protein
MTDNSESTNKSNSVLKTISEVRESLQHRKQQHAEKATQYGIADDVFAQLEKFAKRVPEEILKPAEPAYKRFNLFIEESERDWSAFNPASNAIVTVGTSTAVAEVDLAPFQESMDEFYEQFNRPSASWNRERSAEYARRLQQLDPELGRLFRGISEAFWGSVDNPERTALGLARQCFDHLFQVLAPDDNEIRQSSFFEQKNGDKPHAIHRLERIKFAASVRVRNKITANYLIEQAADLVQAYDDLQVLHARRPIERERAYAILKTFMAAMEEWIDALEL